MSNTLLQSPSKSWYRYIWPWLLLLGPLSVVLAGSYTAWLAFTRQDAMVVGDYYKQGKAINQDLRRDRNATNLALKSVLRYDAAVGQLTGFVSSRGEPYVGKIHIRLVHSTLPEKDISLETTLDQSGKIIVALPMLEMARWQILIENVNREWRLNGTWTWPHEREVSIIADVSPVD